MLVTAVILFATPSGYRLDLMLGTTWRVTTANVVLLSLPSLIRMMHATKELAPTRLALAGAGAGLVSGAQGLLVYSIYSSEMSIPFWGIWFVLAIEKQRDCRHPRTVRRWHAPMRRLQVLAPSILP